MGINESGKFCSKPSCCLEKWGSCPDCLICEIVDGLGCPPYQIGERHPRFSEYDKDYVYPSNTKLKERFEELRDESSDSNDTEGRDNTDNTDYRENNIIVPTPQPEPMPDIDNTYDNTPTRCTTCGGSGVCTSCHGKGGKYEDTGYYTGESSLSWIPCPGCNGSCKCYMCYGTGHL